MKIKIKNLGILKQAELELGDFTIICGENNTGKTYATCALYGFLHDWTRRTAAYEIGSQNFPPLSINELLEKGVQRIELENYTKERKNILKTICDIYKVQLPSIFASKEEYFKNSDFQVTLEDEPEKIIDKEHEAKIESYKDQIFTLHKKKGEQHLTVTLLAKKNKGVVPTRIIRDIIYKFILQILFGEHFPNPFISSTERTDAAIFWKELYFTRNRLLEEMANSNKKNIDPIALFSKSYRDYALPVKNNVDFTRKLAGVAQKESFLYKEHPDILNSFADIIGGEYVVENDAVYFKPKNQSIKLTMDESSSAVRSLLIIGFYLRHIAKKGDLLMVDEPELNLHPANQRRITRLFARLVNLGIKVFITTHSDYIVKELNLLTMLKQNKSYIKDIIKEKKYHQDELISYKKIRVYIAKKDSILLDGNSRKSTHYTLVKAPITEENGITVESFDNDIDEMNEIEDKIMMEE